MRIDSASPLVLTLLLVLPLAACTVEPLDLDEGAMLISIENGEGGFTHTIFSDRSARTTPRRLRSG